MRTSLQRMFILSGVIFVLAGCGGASGQVEDHIETLEESSLQQDLQSLINYENQLQEDFEESLDNEDLSNFKESSASVFSNAYARNTLLESLTEHRSQSEEVYEELQDITFPEEDADIEGAAASMTDNLETVNNTLESFVPQYEEALNSEREYFNSLGESSADYDNFSSGLETVNEQHGALNDLYHTLDEAITNLNANKNRALEIINGEGDS